MKSKNCDVCKCRRCQTPCIDCRCSNDTPCDKPIKVCQGFEEINSGTPK